MEIGISKNGELRVLTLKGKLHLQHWRVIDKHLDAMLAAGVRRVVLDLSEVSVLEGAGTESLLKSAGRFRDLGAELLLVAGDPGVREAIRASGCFADGNEHLFPDWNALRAAAPTHSP
jgi:anti-anti-sigma factor